MMHLRIKNHLNPDVPFSLDVPPECPIGDLKILIERDYPGHPLASSQKLIFSGKILRDEEILKEVTQQYNAPEHTFHLLVSSSSLQVDPAPSASPTSAAGDGDGDGDGGGLRHRGARAGGVDGPPGPFGMAGVAEQAAGGVDGPHGPFGMAGVAEQAARGHAARRGFLETQNFRLVLKLALVLYIFGRHAGTVRFATMVVGAFVLYMYQIGLIGPRPHSTRPRRQPPRDGGHHGAAAPPGPALDGAGGPPTPRAPPAQPQASRAMPRPAEEEEEEEDPAAIEAPVPPPTPASHDAVEGDPEGDHHHSPAHAQHAPAAQHAHAPASSPGPHRAGVFESVVGPFFYSLLPSWTPDAGYA